MMHHAVLIALLLFSIPSVCAQSALSTYGNTQLDQLLSDRPDMKDVLPIDDVIVRWVVRRFDSGPNGERVRWDSREPFSGREAENQSGAHTYIRITNSADVTGSDKWFLLVFELNNIPRHFTLNKLLRDARQQRVTREIFVRACVGHEFEALVRTARFFRRHPIPGATVQNAPIYLRSSHYAESFSFQSHLNFLDSLDDDAYDPREYFGRYYDRLSGLN